MTDRPGVACTVMTADCLPALFCDRAGTRVAAAHAGWRGLAGGVLEATLDRLALPPEEVLVWLGPAIGPQAFEVGLEVREAFTAVHPEAARAFVEGERPGKLMADIYEPGAYSPGCPWGDRCVWWRIVHGQRCAVLLLSPYPAGWAVCIVGLAGPALACTGLFAGLPANAPATIQQVDPGQPRYA